MSITGPATSRGVPSVGDDVHAEAGRGVDLDDRAADLLVAAGDVGRDEVHAADVEADGLHGALGHEPVVVVDDVGLVDRRAAGRQVAGRAQVEDLPLREDRLGGQPGLLEQAERLVVDLQPGEVLLVADAAPRIAVDQLDELGDRAPAVPHDVAGDALRHRHHLAVHHQDPVVVPGLAGLDDHAVRVLLRLLEGGRAPGRGRDVDRDPAAVIAVERLDHHREADALGLLHRLLDVVHDALPRDRQAEVLQDAVGQPLVRGDLDRDLARLAGDRGLDAPLVLAVSELDQGGVVEAQPGDAALLSGLHQGAGRRSEGAALREAHQALELLLKARTARDRAPARSGGSRWRTMRSASRPAASPTASST